jgi:hypothetical protein
MPIHHETKAGGEFGRSIRGASAIFGALDQALFWVRPKGQETNRRILKTLGRYDTPPELLFDWDKEKGHTVLGTPEDMPAQNFNQVTKALSNRPQSVTAIAEKAGTTDKVARTILEKLRERGEVHRGGSGVKNDSHVYFIPSL